MSDCGNSGRAFQNPMVPEAPAQHIFHHREPLNQRISWKILPSAAGTAPFAAPSVVIRCRER